MTVPQGIYSEASLGKAYLKEMGVRPWRKVQEDFDPAVLGAIVSSIFRRSRGSPHPALCRAGACSSATKPPTP